MNQDEPQELAGPHMLGGSLAAFWDSATPLPATLGDALRLRFPEAPWLPQAAEQPQSLDAPPAWLASLAPGVADCFVNYVDDCELHEDWAGVQAAIPHFATLAGVTGQLARAATSGELLPLLHRLRSCWVRALYLVGRYNQAWLGGADLPLALATHLSAAECREAWIINGLLALETGQYAAAAAALARATEISAPAGRRSDWLLALGQADLAAACERNQTALLAYAALEDAAAPAWVRLCGAVGQARVWTKLGHIHAAAPLIETARNMDAAGWCSGLAGIAAAELALMCGQPAQASEHASAARLALAAALGDEHPAAAAATLIAAQASYATGRYAEAARLNAAVLPQLRAAHGLDHPQVVQALVLQGLLAGLRGDTRALVRDLAAAERAARLLGEQSEIHAISAAILQCTIALAQGRGKRACAIAIGALEHARATLDALHPLAVACVDAVAECERRQGRWSVARVYADLALALRKSVFGAEHPLTATSWEQLGHIDLDARLFACARDRLNLVVRIRRSALGAAHPQTAAAQFALARAYLALGELSPAQAAATEALAGFEGAYGAMHPATKAARALLGQFSSPLRRNWWRARARLRRTQSGA